MSANLFPIMGKPDGGGGGKATSETKTLVLQETKVTTNGSYAMKSKAGLAAPESAGVASALPALANGDGTTEVRTFTTLKWQGQQSDKEVLSRAPLVEPLQRLGLNPSDSVHVKRVYVRSMSLVGGKAPIGIRFSQVNGKDLALEHHEGDHFTWSTLTAHPGDVRHYDHLNDGKGLLLQESELSAIDKINSKVSMQNIMKDIKQLPEYNEDGVQTHYHVLADFSGFTDPDAHGKEKTKTLSHAALMVYNNAKNQINEHPEILKHLAGVPLKRPKPGHTDIFSDIDVRHDNTSAKHPNRFWLVVKADEMDRALQLHKQKIDAAPVGTDPTKHTVSVFRPGQTDPSIDSKSTNTIGNIATQGGVTAADHERSKTVWSTMHLALTYEIEHPQLKNAVVATAPQKS